ncbi:MAG: DUF542 domain-containing protein [Halofilum sp. (in: g-proteobacteria)]|nr:DUF542 domain-containing protein [Halofilum sp. (in: g-proteobacteria)]
MSSARDNATPPTRTLDDIVAASSRAIEVFDWFGLDYCCGGDESLGLAATHAGLDPAAVIYHMHLEHNVLFPRLSGNRELADNS